MKPALRQLFSWNRADTHALIAGSVVLALCSVSWLHEWAIMICLFLAGVLGGGKLGDLAKDDEFIVRWTKLSLLCLAVSSFIVAWASDFGAGYWGNYVASLCLGVWGYGAGVFVGFADYFRRDRSKGPGASTSHAPVTA